MGKSIRSKIKKYWRTQLRNTIGKEHVQKQEAEIQRNLQNTIKSQEGSSIAKMKEAFGSNAQPVVSEETAMNTDEVPVPVVAKVTKKKVLPKKAKNKTKRGKKFVHFHNVVKKGT